MSHGSSIEDLERILDTIQEHLLEAREVITSLRNVEMADISYQDDTLPEMNPKLSKVAKSAIENTQGPLQPEDLEKFLMEEVFGKPKPNILPIVRQYTPAVEDLMSQVIDLKKVTNESHSRYKEEQRRLDVNLNKRIDTLVANMRKELEKEAAERRSQMSMDIFVRRETS